MEYINKIKSIELVLENCECIPLPVEDIYIYFDIDHTFYYSIDLLSESETIRNLEKSPRAKNVYITVKNTDKLTYTSFGIDKELNSLDRIKSCPDITHIDVTYEQFYSSKEDGYLPHSMGIKTLYFGVPWGSNSQFINTYQRIKYDKKHDKYILTIKKYFTFKTLKYNFKEWERNIRRNVFHNYTI